MCQQNQREPTEQEKQIKYAYKVVEKYYSTVERYCSPHKAFNFVVGKWAKALGKGYAKTQYGFHVFKKESDAKMYATSFQYVFKVEIKDIIAVGTTNLDLIYKPIIQLETMRVKELKLLEEC